MKSKKEVYKPFGGGNNKSLISRAAKKAAIRAENYSFKSRNGVPGEVGFMISSEMRSLAEERSSMFDPTASLDRWTDRGSILAAPAEAADMYVMSNRGSSNIVFNGPRFYHDELNVTNNDPETGMPVPPDVSRFPYSDEAHAASKKLAAKLAKNLARRHYAAAVMQRSFRAKKSIQKFRAEVQEAQMAARKIQWFWRKRLFRTRAARAEWKVHCKYALKIQCMVRCWSARRKVRRRKARKLRDAIVVISRFFIFAKKEFKRKRGRNVRRRVHATRLQAKHRGKMGRRRVRRMHWASQRISQCWRNWWLRKKGKFAIKIYHFLRRSVVHRKAHRLQSIVRGFLGRRYFHRNRLSFLSFERHRQTVENELINNELTRDVREACYSWTVQPSLDYGNELPRDTATDIMRCLDVSSRCILYPSKDKNGVALERRIQAIDSELTIDNLPGGSRRYVALAVLAVFSNRPSGMIDYIGLEACKPYLTPIRTGRNAPDTDVWEELQHEPTVSILYASTLLEPTLALRCRVSIQNHLPDFLLAQAALVRRWTHHTDYILKRAIWKSRIAFPAKYCCADCLEAVTTPAAMRNHLPCQRVGWSSWVSRKSYALQQASLLSRLAALKAYPPVARQGIDEDRKSIALKINSRREIARKRNGAFNSLVERHEFVAASLDHVTNLDPLRKVDKKALRLQKEANVRANLGVPQSPLKNSTPPKKSPGRKEAPSKDSPVQNSQTNSPSSKKEISGGGIMVPPAGVDFIPFFEEYFSCAKDMISELNDEDWLKKPGGSDQKIQKPARDKDGILQNFELEPDKALKKVLKKEAKKKAAASKKK